MFQFSKADNPRSKCYFTQISGPQYVDAEHPPTKRKPFSIFLEHPYSHTVDLILPNEVYELVKQYLESDAAKLRYARVFLSLKDILEGPFFNEYIKKGHIALLSEGRPGVDNVFSIHNGVLRIELDRPTYERCGLDGKPIANGGRKHMKSRFAIEYNLRLPSMVHGKPGFERIKWACKNVLVQSMSWLFCDLRATDPPTAPIEKHHPLHMNEVPNVQPTTSIITPDLSDINVLGQPENASDLYEWLHLVLTNSPRVREGDSINPFISRYEIPEFNDKGGVSRDLIRVRWHGFVTPQFVAQLWLQVHKEVKHEWAFMSVGCFEGRSYSVMDLGKRGTLCWECK